jgi:hypothetical protein
MRVRVVAPAMMLHHDRVVYDVFVSSNDDYIFFCEDYMDCR